MFPLSNSTNFNDQYLPIEPIWALKSTLPSLIFLPVFAFILAPTFITGISFSTNSSHSLNGIIYAVFYILIIPTHFFANVLRRATFHYSLEDKFLNLSQGVIKKQNRQFPYGVIQNVVVSRGVLDRIFGLSTLTIQNAATGANTPTTPKAASQAMAMAGFWGNTVNIPGLTKENAEAIKTEILNRIQRSPTQELGL